MLKDHKAKVEVEQWTKQFQSNRKNYLELRDSEADTQSVPIMPSGLFKELRQAPVSYTHLTLPTICSV